MGAVCCSIEPNTVPASQVDAMLGDLTPRSPPSPVASQTTSRRRADRVAGFSAKGKVGSSSTSAGEVAPSTCTNRNSASPPPQQQQQQQGSPRTVVHRLSPPAADGPAGVSGPSFRPLLGTHRDGRSVVVLPSAVFAAAQHSQPNGAAHPTEGSSPPAATASYNRRLPPLQPRTASNLSPRSLHLMGRAGAGGGGGVGGGTALSASNRSVVCQLSPQGSNDGALGRSTSAGDLTINSGGNGCSASNELQRGVSTHASEPRMAACAPVVGLMTSRATLSLPSLICRPNTAGTGHADATERWGLGGSHDSASSNGDAANPFVAATNA